MHDFEPHWWQEQAKALFFIEHLRMTEIAEIVKKSRETISRFISSCEGYEEEKAFRKSRSIIQRKEYRKEWDRKNRSTLNPAAMAISKESLRREHELAVRILSSEKY